MLSTPTTTTTLAIVLAISCIGGIAHVQAGYENHAAAQSVGATSYGVGKPISESHDFSDNGASSHYESLGTLADHLQRRHFPADYANDNEAGTVEYAEAEAAATSLHEQSASEHYEHAPQLDFGAYAQSNQIDLHGDFHSEPVVGIDHGKGAFSYSTLYEHKHEQALEHKELL